MQAFRASSPPEPSFLIKRHDNLSLQNYIRIYKADGTYTTIPCQLTSTTADIVQVLTSKMQGKTGFRLFIRERSSGVSAGSPCCVSDGAAE
jgi:hypothetical protein